MARVSGPGTFSVLSSDGSRVQTEIPGLALKVLTINRERDSAVVLMKIQPGTRYPAHHHSGAEECYVLAGEVTIKGRRLHAGDFHHAEPGSDHDALFSEAGWADSFPPNRPPRLSNLRMLRQDWNNGCTLKCHGELTRDRARDSHWSRRRITDVRPTSEYSLGVANRGSCRVEPCRSRRLRQKRTSLVAFSTNARFFRRGNLAPSVSRSSV